MTDGVEGGIGGNGVVGELRMGYASRAEDEDDFVEVLHRAELTGQSSSRYCVTQCQKCQPLGIISEYYTEDQPYESSIRKWPAALWVEHSL
jgi:hypothetical protein